MKIFDLYRMVEGPDFTLGRLEDEENREVCVIAEKGWVDKDNNGIGDDNVSRIQAGEYECERDIHNKRSETRYECWELCDVKGRSEIHMHRGNDPRVHSKGCLLVGTKFGENGTVIGSIDAYKKWMELTKNETKIKIRIHDIPKNENV